MNFSKYLKGGSCTTVGKITTPSCGNVNVEQYKSPCSHLPLDNFSESQTGGCSAPTKDCLQNTNYQLGVTPSSPYYSNLSESAFSARLHTGKTASGGGKIKKKKKKRKQKKQKRKQKGSGFYLDVNKGKIGGLAEVGDYVDCHPPQNPEMTGGAQFTRIVNPETGRRVSIYGKTGMKVLRNYLNILNGGGVDTPLVSNFDPNMVNREFGCRQPVWKPECV